LRLEIADNGQRKVVHGSDHLDIMIRQIYSDYHLPIQPQDLTMKDLHFWYDSLIPGLIELQKQAKQNKELARKKKR